MKFLRHFVLIGFCLSASACGSSTEETSSNRSEASARRFCELKEECNVDSAYSVDDCIAEEVETDNEILEEYGEDCLSAIFEAGDCVSANTSCTDESLDETAAQSECRDVVLEAREICDSDFPFGGLDLDENEEL